jgi:hypothetical protein
MAEFPPDEELLDFDPTRYAEWDRATADRLLVEEPVLYRNHLAIALWIEQWADRAEKDPAADLGEDFHEGQQVVFLHIIAHLRQGDFIPGHGIYERQPHAK